MGSFVPRCDEVKMHLVSVGDSLQLDRRESPRFRPAGFRHSDAFDADHAGHALYPPSGVRRGAMLGFALLSLSASLITPVVTPIHHFARVGSIRAATTSTFHAASMHETAVLALFGARAAKALDASACRKLLAKWADECDLRWQGRVELRTVLPFLGDLQDSCVYVGQGSLLREDMWAPS